MREEVGALLVPVNTLPAAVEATQLWGGTIKRSGHFENGEAVGEWITYDSKGEK